MVCTRSLEMILAAKTLVTLELLGAALKSLKMSPKNENNNVHQLHNYLRHEEIIITDQTDTPWKNIPKPNYSSSLSGTFLFAFDLLESRSGKERNRTYDVKV